MSQIKEKDIVERLPFRVSLWNGGKYATAETIADARHVSYQAIQNYERNKGLIRRGGADKNSLYLLRDVVKIIEEKGIHKRKKDLQNAKLVA